MRFFLRYGGAFHALSSASGGSLTETILEPRPISFGDALGVLIANEGVGDVLVLVSEQDAPVSSVVASFTGTLGPLEMRDRPLMDDEESSNPAGAATFTVAGATVEIVAQHLKSVGVVLEGWLLFELQGVTLEVRGLRID